MALPHAARVAWHLRTKFKKTGRSFSNFSELNFAKCWEDI